MYLRNVSRRRGLNDFFPWAPDCTGKGPANALFRSFQDLRVIHYEDVVDTAEWGLQKMRIGRIVAQKD